MAEYFGASSSLASKVKEFSGCGKGKYCCIPGCKSASVTKEGKTSGISLFQFPKDHIVAQQWSRVIAQFRRRGGADSFRVNKNTRVCEFHFKANEIRVSLGIGRKTLIKGSVPSVFNFRQVKETCVRRSPRKRLCLPSVEIETSPGPSCEKSVCNNCLGFQDDISKLKEENAALATSLRSAEVKLTDVSSRLLELQQQRLNYQALSQEPHVFQSFTGLTVEKFKVLFELVDPGKGGENLKYHDSSSKMSKSVATRGKSGPKSKVSGLEQLFIFLAWLRCGFSLSHASRIFLIPKSTLSRYLITWSNYLFFTLCSISIWPSQERVAQTMPDVFKQLYPSTRLIIDCTDLFCQCPSSLSIQSALYSKYKQHVTYKGLLGIDPCGNITFVSQLYDGSTSDKDIFKRCGLLHPKLWNHGDSVMADRGFPVGDLLAPLGVNLNIPDFLDGRDQLTSDEVIESQSIASVRIHIERAISRVKKFRQLQSEIPLVLHGSINQIWTVACLLCNFLPPLIKQGP